MACAGSALCLASRGARASMRRRRTPRGAAAAGAAARARGRRARQARAAGAAAQNPTLNPMNAQVRMAEAYRFLPHSFPTRDWSEPEQAALRGGLLQLVQARARPAAAAAAPAGLPCRGRCAGSRNGRCRERERPAMHAGARPGVAGCRGQQC